jgi:glutamyl-Q tRNA(Asp) synthetase
LDARANHGRWLVRIDDLDTPRVVPGSADGILRTLEGFGFQWDDEVVYQSARTSHYLDALQTLERQGLTFPCSCSRAQLADEERYPGHCRERPLLENSPTATRLRVEPGVIQFTDRIQGTFRQDVAAAVGDMALRRRDHLFTYVLAVVVDDAREHISRVVRGADLLDNTPRQIYLQRLLGLHTPEYAHLPVLLEPDGRKLAKSSRSVHLEVDSAISLLYQVFQLLNLQPPPEISTATIPEVWRWAIGQWTNAPKLRHLSLALQQ